MTNKREAPANVRVVDLFAGCGGLSLGFELFQGPVSFETVMALDNDRAVIRCYNANHQPDPNLGAVGRVADLTWFSHPSEVLLYFLTHYARSHGDEILAKELARIDQQKFLRKVAEIDQAFIEGLEELTASPPYREAMAEVPNSCFRLAICKSFLSRLGIVSLTSGGLDRDSLPWTEECGELVDDDAPALTFNIDQIDTEISQSISEVWDAQIEKLSESSERMGTGQHRVVNSQIRELVGFLSSDQGMRLGDAWIQWRSLRDTLRASYCLSVESDLEQLYWGGRQVDLLLGGPPCKGFSRIARPVMESLRMQGVSSWSSRDFGDERNALMYQYVLFLRALRPQVFVFENVSNFASVLKTPAGEFDAPSVLEELIEELSDHQVRFAIRSMIVNSADLGVPQNRSRFIMVGFDASLENAERAAEEFFDLPMHADEVPLQVALMGLEPPVEFTPGAKRFGRSTAYRSKTYRVLDPAMPRSWASYLQWVQRSGPTSDVAGETDSHIYRKLREDDVLLLKRFGPGQRWMDYLVSRSPTLAALQDLVQQVSEVSSSNPHLGLPDSEELDAVLKTLDDRLALRLVLEHIESTLDGDHHLLGESYMGQGKGHGDWFERLSPSRPCKTIIAHIGKDTYSYFHPYENRAITIREAARVQSFPDSFLFGSAGVVEAYSMIGNAVPPLMAHAFAERLSQMNQQYRIVERRVDAPGSAGTLKQIRRGVVPRPAIAEAG